jgi:hypothetical protein
MHCSPANAGLRQRGSGAQPDRGLATPYGQPCPHSLRYSPAGFSEFATSFALGRRSQRFRATIGLEANPRANTTTFEVFTDEIRVFE